MFVPKTDFFNRELSWIAFNRRVLEEAQTADNPLIERARFLAITSSNLDEFFMVRMAGLHRSLGDKRRDPAGLTATEQLQEARLVLQQLVCDQYLCWRGEVEPALNEQGFSILRPDAWSVEERISLQAYFRSQMAPVLTPLAVDPGRPYPLLAGGVIHLAVQLQPPAGDPRPGPVQALVSLPGGRRLLSLPGREGVYALAEDVLATFIDHLFPGYRIVSRLCFRINRDAELEFDEEEATDLLVEIEEELRHRGHGKPVRLEVEAGAPSALREWLIETLAVEPGDLFDIDGPLDLTFLMSLDQYLPVPELQFPPFIPCVLQDWSEPFDLLRKQEVLLHHPFDSFQPVADLVERAAADDKVLAIKQALYRVSGNSPVVRALMRAARAGKQVTVLVELKARFDEEANIRWSRRLEEAGAHVIYGLVGYKVHAKLLLIIRRDEDGLRRYCHLGTGNYNDKTARLYTDISYLTTNEAVGRDMAALFNVLTGFAQPPEWERLSVAPTVMRQAFIDLLRREAAITRAGGAGRVICKFNSLNDVKLIEELYAASQAGVSIDLIVRGICILRPGVPGLSDNIRVRSIIGRFLEHSRIFYFAGDGQPYLGIASADWMSRNLDRRVEHLVRIDEAELIEAMLTQLGYYLADNESVRVLQPDGSYQRLRRPSGGQPPAQQHMLELAALSMRRDAEQSRRPTRFRPAKAPQ